MGSAPPPTESSIHGTRSSKNLRVSDLESVYSDCGDADSADCWQQREDEFHDAADLAESIASLGPSTGDAGETANDGQDLTKPQANEDFHEFHDAPEARDSLETMKDMSSFKPEIPAPPSSVGPLRKAQCDRKLQRPTKLFDQKLCSARKDETAKKESSISRLSTARKGASPSTKEKHDRMKRIPISQGRPSNYSGVLLELKERLSSNQRTPLSVTRKLLQSRNDPLSKTIDDMKKRNNVVSNLLQKKSLHVTLDKDQKGNSLSKSEEKSDRLPTPVSSNQQPKPGSAKSRLEQIKSIKQKIAVCRTSSLVDKSFNGLRNVELKANPYSVPAIKSPLIVKKRPPELIIKKKSELNVKTLYENKQEEVLKVETPNENINKEKCPVTENKLNRTNFSEEVQTDEINMEYIQPKCLDSCVNTDPVEETNDETVELKTKLDMHFQRETGLKCENDTLREAIIRFQKKEIDLRKEISALTDLLSKSKESIREMEKKMLEKDTTIAMLKPNIGKVQNLSEKIKIKDASIADLQSKLTVAKDDYTSVKKELEKLSSELNQVLKEKESLKNLIAQLRKEKDSLGSKNIEISQKMSDIEKEGANNLKLLSEAAQLNNELKRDLEVKSKEISDLKDKLDSDRPASPNIVGLSEQLIEKDAIISELEKLRDGVQLLNKEVCGMIASVFEDLGEEKPESEVEQLVSSGRTLALKQSLLCLLEAHRAREADREHEECRRVIFNLEDRAAVLEAELEEARGYSASLAGYISPGWEPAKIPETKETSGREMRVAGKPSGDLPETRHFMSRSHHELYVLLEGKRQALATMERRVQELEEVHANCSQKRVRNEMRIDQLEMALAAVDFH